MILLDNAVKFTPPGGNIEIALSRREQRWVCSVSDNGPGISEAAQARVFERFFRETRSGERSHDGCGPGIGNCQIDY